MGTTRLQLYNDALLMCGETFLAALTDETEPRRLLDHVWDTGWVSDCLERGAWHFAMRTVRLEVDDDFTTPDFGFQNAFTQPEDWVRTEGVCSDEFFRTPLRQYVHEVGYFFADIDPLYLQYVSNDEQYGGDLSLWPPSFGRYAAAHGAGRVITKLSGKSEQAVLLNGPAGRPELGQVELLLKVAKNLAARTQPTKMPVQGNWSRARGGSNSNSDGGPTGRLI